MPGYGFGMPTNRVSTYESAKLFVMMQDDVACSSTENSAHASNHLNESIGVLPFYTKLPSKAQSASKITHRIHFKRSASSVNLWNKSLFTPAVYGTAAKPPVQRAASPDGAAQWRAFTTYAKHPLFFMHGIGATPAYKPYQSIKTRFDTIVRAIETMLADSSFGLALHSVQSRTSGYDTSESTFAVHIMRLFYDADEQMQALISTRDRSGHRELTHVNFNVQCMVFCEAVFREFARFGSERKDKTDESYHAILNGLGKMTPTGFELEEATQLVAASLFFKFVKAHYTPNPNASSLHPSTLYDATTTTLVTTAPRTKIHRTPQLQGRMFTKIVVYPNTYMLVTLPEGTIQHDGLAADAYKSTTLNIAGQLEVSVKTITLTLRKEERLLLRNTTEDLLKATFVVLDGPHFVDYFVINPAIVPKIPVGKQVPLTMQLVAMSIS